MDDDYVTVEFRIHKDDYKPGLSICWLYGFGQMIPHTWDYEGRSSKMIVTSEATVADDGVKHVFYKLYGGTVEQFLHTAEQNERYCEVHGWVYDGSQHLPRSAYKESAAA